MSVSTARRPKVKPCRVSQRPAAPFGQGLLASHPAYRVPYTASDIAWWTAERLRAEDVRYDAMAAEAGAMDCLERGLLL